MKIPFFAKHLSNKDFLSTHILYIIYTTVEKILSIGLTQIWHIKWYTYKIKKLEEGSSLKFYSKKQKIVHGYNKVNHKDRYDISNV